MHFDFENEMIKFHSKEDSVHCLNARALLKKRKMTHLTQHKDFYQYRLHGHLLPYELSPKVTQSVGAEHS